MGGTEPTFLPKAPRRESEGRKINLLNQDTVSVKGDYPPRQHLHPAPATRVSYHADYSTLGFTSAPLRITNPSLHLSRLWDAERKHH